MNIILYSYLIELAEGNEELAMDKHENLTHLSLSCLATMVNIPLEVENGTDGRRKVRLDLPVTYLFFMYFLQTVLNFT